MSIAQQRPFFHLVSWIIFLSAFVLPAIPIADSLPSFQLADLGLPLIALSVFIAFRKEDLHKLKPVLLPWGILVACILLSMAVNGRLGVMRDHYELARVAKFVLVFLFFALQGAELNMDKSLKAIFIFLLIFNALHYIDLFGFNQLLHWYAADVHVTTFGLDSLGRPDSKRILGTPGNPNNNAILFLFYILWFFPNTKTSLSGQAWFIAAVLAFLACQSRTGTVAFAVIYFTGAWLRKFSAKEIFIHLGIFISLYGLLFVLGDVYISSIIDPNLMKSGSARGRLETWALLWDMIKEKPLLGYAPFKEYFYANNLHSESEYFLYLWRYGFIGLIVLLTIYFFPARLAWLESASRYGFCLFLFTLVMLICSAMNNPLSNQNILLIFAMLTGLFIAHRHKHSATA